METSFENLYPPIHGCYKLSSLPRPLNSHGFPSLGPFLKLLSQSVTDFPRLCSKSQAFSRVLPLNKTQTNDLKHLSTQIKKDSHLVNILNYGVQIKCIKVR